MQCDQANVVFVEHYEVWQLAEIICSLLSLKFLTFHLSPSHIAENLHYGKIS